MKVIYEIDPSEKIEKSNNPDCFDREVDLI